MVMPAFNLTTQEAEASGSEFKASPDYLLSEFLACQRYTVRPYLENKQKLNPLFC